MFKPTSHTALGTQDESHDKTPEGQFRTHNGSGNGPVDQESSMVERAKLLDAANNASQYCATLHLGFMALCAYVMVIVFGTTDLDLLVGKSLTLPVLSVAIPIAGFYAAAPFLVVLVHFNLLLQLQLLSRKLYAFDAVAPKDEGPGDLREQLHIFPFTSYMVGRPSPVVHVLVELLISVTLVLLPLVTLFALQLRFLAYQDESITWVQRTAIWLDVGLALFLWPIIMHSKDDWRAYWRDLIDANVQRRRAWLAVALLFAGLTLSLQSVSLAVVLTAVCVYVVSPLAIVVLSGRKAFTGVRLFSNISLLVTSALLVSASIKFHVPLFLLGLLVTVPLAAFWNPRAPRGAFALLTSLLLGLSLPPAMLVDGEKLEAVVLEQPKPAGLTGHSTVFCDYFLFRARHLWLAEQVLLAKPTEPENVALIRSGEWRKVRRHIEPIDLQGRNIRGAQLIDVILVDANLAEVNLQGANLLGGHLEGANLREAQLQGANLNSANLQGAHMYKSRLQKAALEGTNLQGADLGGARLQGAIMRGAELEAANLHHAQLQGADLEGAQLQGAIFELASLQGADLQQAQLNGADLERARIAGAVSEGQIGTASGELVDVRGMDVRPISQQELREVVNQLEHTWGIEFMGEREASIARLGQAAKGEVPKFELDSCLAESTSPINCRDRFDPENVRELADFKRALHAGLTILSCDSPDIAEGIINRLQLEMPDSPRQGLGIVLGRRMISRKSCPGLQEIDPAMKEWLRNQMEPADK